MGRHIDHLSPFVIGIKIKGKIKEKGKRKEKKRKKAFFFLRDLKTNK